MTPDLAQRRRERAIVRQMDKLRAEVSSLRQKIEQGPPIITQPTVRRLVQVAAAEFGITELQLTSYCRARPFVVPRQVVMHVAATTLGHGVARIARVLGRDHSTVIHGVAVTAARIAADPAFAARVERVAQAVLTEPSTENAA